MAYEGMEELLEELFDTMRRWRFLDRQPTIDEAKETEATIDAFRARAQIIFDAIGSATKGEER